MINVILPVRSVQCTVYSTLSTLNLLKLETSNFEDRLLTTHNTVSRFTRVSLQSLSLGIIGRADKVVYLVLSLIILFNGVRMAIRTSKRAIALADTEGHADHPEMQTRIEGLENDVESLQRSLDMSKLREKKLAVALENFGLNPSLVVDMEEGHDKTSFSTKNLICPLEPELTFVQALSDRGGWLIGLLIFQSCSSFILSANEELLRDHPSIVYFLTMLVGAGGNAGNQAAVRVIRGIAVGALNERSISHFMKRELVMAFSLSALLGMTGLVRALLSAQTSLAETVAITLTLMIIVFISIITGAFLPLLLQRCRLDPAHSSTSIQVIMDISGVLITCFMATTILDTPIGRLFLAKLGVYG